MSEVDFAAFAAAPRMQPQITPGSRPFWTSGGSGKLRLWREQRSGRWLHPFAPLPTDTSGLVEEATSGKATLYTYTVDEHQYHPEVKPPYIIALVELYEQSDLRLPTNIINCSIADLAIGMPMKVTFDQRGDVYYPLFEPDV